MSEQHPTRFYEFGPFRLDVAEGQLWRDGEAIQLTRKSFKVLTLLVANGSHVVDKNELMRKVWPDAFVEENRLADNISTLRKLLGDDPRSPSYIQTVPGRGYRFVADVRQVNDDAVALVERTRTHVIIQEDSESRLAAADTDARASREESVDRALPPMSRPRSLNPRIIAFACVLVVAVAFAAYLALKSKPEQDAAQAPLPRSIAVLPFKPLVANERNESLELGMADTLITRLSNINQVLVRPISAVRKYSDPEQDSVAAGRALSVDSVLDGNIQKVGDQLRVTARLVRVSDGTTMWADKFDTEVTHLFAVQDSISEKVVRALALTLTGEEMNGLSKRYTDNVEAYQLYLQGRYLWTTFKPDNLVSSINFYRAALEKDPKYALAYAGIAVSYSTIGIYGPLSAREAGPKASDAALKAVELDDQLAEAHVSLGVVKLFYEWDWEGARRELERGIQLDPNTTGHTPYGYYLATMGRFDEALAELKRTSEMSPGWHIARNDVLMTLYDSRRYDEAEAQCQQAIKLDPNDWGPYLILGQVQAQRRMYKEAIATLQRGLKIDSANLRISAQLGYVYALSGETDRAMAIILQLKKSPASLAPYLIAVIYVGLGDNDQAFAWLDKAYEDRFPFLCDVRISPQFDSLRSDSRYAALVGRMNLSP